MSEPAEKRGRVLKQKKSAERQDPVQGVKFESVELESEEHKAVIAYRNECFCSGLLEKEEGRRLHSGYSEGIWDEGRMLVKVAKPKGKHWKTMGHPVKFEGVGTLLCLYPEEALWFVDTGNLLLKSVEGVVLDRRWLWERLFALGLNQGSEISPQHFAAFSYFRSLGYAVARWKWRVPSPQVAEADPESWNRVFVAPSKQEGARLDGAAPLTWIVFEVWKAASVSTFKKSSPPPSDWRVLAWPLDSTCWPAAAWSSVAGAESMVALSGVTGTAPSFFQVSWQTLPRNPMAPARMFEGFNDAELANATAVQRKWFPHVSQWGSADDE